MVTGHLATAESPVDLERPFQRFSEFIDPTPDDRASIFHLADKPIALDRGVVIREQGVDPTCVYLLIEGWASASIDLKDGTRQIVKIHLPGDLMGMPSISLVETADTLVALTPVVVGKVPLDNFVRLFTTSPRFAMAMFLSAQRERVALMDMLTRIGRTSSRQRVAWLILDLHKRLSSAGLCGPTWFDLMLMQCQMSEVLGITSVHLNRVFRQLQKDGLIRRDRQRIKIIERGKLLRLAGWQARASKSNPKWLPQDQALATRS